MTASSREGSNIRRRVLQFAIVPREWKDLLLLSQLFGVYKRAQRLRFKQALIYSLSYREPKSYHEAMTGTNGKSLSRIVCAQPMGFLVPSQLCVSMRLRLPFERFKLSGKSPPSVMTTS